MVRGLLRLAVLLALASGSGCSLFFGEDEKGRDTLGMDRGPLYILDWTKVGTGEQALVPKNDGGYMNGMPLDARTK